MVRETRKEINNLICITLENRELTDKVYPIYLEKAEAGTELEQTLVARGYEVMGSAEELKRLGVNIKTNET